MLRSIMLVSDIGLTSLLKLEIIMIALMNPLPQWSQPLAAPATSYCQAEAAIASLILSRLKTQMSECVSILWVL